MLVSSPLDRPVRLNFVAIVRGIRRETSVFLNIRAGFAQKIT
jgi:hypothetical protein